MKPTGGLGKRWQPRGFRQTLTCRPTRWRVFLVRGHSAISQAFSSMHNQKDAREEFHHGKLVLLWAHLSLSEVSSPAFCLLSSQLFSEFKQKHENFLSLRLEFCHPYHSRHHKQAIFPRGRPHTQCYCHPGQGRPAQWKPAQLLEYQMALPSWEASGVQEWQAAGDEKLLNSINALTNCWVCMWVGTSLTQPPGSCQSTEQ